MSRVYSFTAIQNIPVSLDTAWDFFSTPNNLQKITPPSLAFTVTSKQDGQTAYAGQIIEYKVSPIAGIPLYWMTEITHVKEKAYFVDEQRFGPYTLWHHQHHFTVIEGGVVMKDIVHYKIPFWLLGDIANSLFVKRQLQTIFDYRFTAVEKEFGEWGKH